MDMKKRTKKPTYFIGTTDKDYYSPLYSSKEEVKEHFIDNGWSNKDLEDLVIYEVKAAFEMESERKFKFIPSALINHVR